MNILLDCQETEDGLEGVTKVCLGHLTLKTKECEHCKADENNQFCPNYSATHIRVYKIEEEKE